MITKDQLNPGGKNALKLSLCTTKNKYHYDKKYYIGSPGFGFLLFAYQLDSVSFFWLLHIEYLQEQQRAVMPHNNALFFPL